MTFVFVCVADKTIIQWVKSQYAWMQCRKLPFLQTLILLFCSFHLRIFWAAITLKSERPRFYLVLSSKCQCTVGLFTVVQIFSYVDNMDHWRDALSSSVILICMQEKGSCGKKRPFHWIVIVIRWKLHLYTWMRSLFDDFSEKQESKFIQIFHYRETSHHPQW